jgi:hypothetical protein
MRIVPALGPAAYVTYSIASPIATHTRPATCEEVNCPAYLSGWTTRAPADLVPVVQSSGRRPAAVTRDGAETVFTFAPGTECFRSSTHRVSLDRPEVFLRRGGDWRGNPAGLSPYRHARPGDWVEDFAEHQARIEKDRS